MTREILFRGKRIGIGDWVEGGIYRGNFTWIITTDVFGKFKHYMVDPSTVGQYTGLTDKNGKRIFEGDILESVWKVGNCAVSRKVYAVTFFCGAFGTERYAHGKRQNNCIPFADIEFGVAEKHCTVIGSIYDNPSLLNEVDA